jgi:FlaA1/EpsC-like NDP-sugar epimerase
VIKLDQERIGATIQGKRVLVTGAGGSIGWELCRQVCRFRPESLVLYERAESPLYELELELKHRFQSVKIVPQLADIRDRQQLEKAFEASRPHVVFHAAAYKHVPMLELHPWKAVKNNICGTRNLIDVATKFAVERFVFVSTDKAVRPVNVMGATKRVAEMLVQGVNGHGSSRSRFITVRFGNVVGSAGSVVPLFRKQIAAGGPVTVTHPEVTRYFMTIPEACQLILQAGAMGEGREIFILDMGTPVKIDDMARDLIRLSGYEPAVDIKIEYIGLRPGEKLYEELITEGEGIVPTTHEKIMVLEGTTCNPQLLNGNIDDLARLAHDQDAEKIKRKLQEIVPEYEPSWLELKWDVRTLEETVALETRATEKSDEPGQGGVKHVSLH